MDNRGEIEALMEALDFRKMYRSNRIVGALMEAHDLWLIGSRALIEARIKRGKNRVRVSLKFQGEL